MSIFSQRLYDTRSRLGLTQGEVANLIPMTQSSYSRIENGFQEPSLAQLKKLGEVLNVSIDYLLDVNTSFYNNQLNQEMVEQIKLIYESYLAKKKDYDDEE